MKMLKIMSLCVLTATLVAGCGESSKTSSEKGEYQPKVSADSVVAVGWRNPTEGKLKKFVDDVFAKAKASKDPEAVQAFAFLKKAGIDNLEVDWGLLTSSKPTVKDGDLEKCPDVALVVSRSHDLKKIVAALCEEAKGELAAEDVTIGGQPAVKFVVKDPSAAGEMKEQGVAPYAASLNGKLLIVASNERCMKNQLALYVEGKGGSPDFKDFALAKDDVLRLAVPQVGKSLSETVGAENLAAAGEVIPDGDKIVASLGTVQLLVRAPGGNAIDISLIAETSAAEHAKTLADAINGAMTPVKAQVKKEAKNNPEAKIAADVLQKFDAKAEGKSLVATLPIPEAVVGEALGEATKLLEKEL